MKFKEYCDERRFATYCFTIDEDISCLSFTEECFIEQNRGYKCRKHRGEKPAPEYEWFHTTLYTSKELKQRNTLL